MVGNSGSLGRSRWRPSKRLLTVLGVIAMLSVLMPTAAGAQDKDVPPPLDDAGQGQVDCGFLGLGDDNSEDNDNTGEATLLTSGTELSDRTVCDGDDDYFVLFAGSGSLLTVDLSFVDADGDIDVTLEPAAGGVVASSLSTTDDESISYVVPSAAFYYARVYMVGSATNDYDITMTVGCNEDGFEPNNDQASAEPVTSGVEVSGQTCAGAGEDDWFSFPVTDGDLIDVDLLFAHADGDLELRLHDEAGNQKTSRTSSSDDETIDAFVADSTGTWAVRVDPIASAENSYDLTVTVMEPPCNEDGFEPNNDQASAEPVTSGVEVSGQTCAGAGEDDWFSFPVADGDLIDVDLLFAHADGDLNIALFDGGGTLKAVAESTNDDEAVSGFVADSAGTWAVRVDPIASAENSYDLTVTVATPVCPEDAFESNDDQASAAPITLGVQVSGASCGGDPTGNDWFSFPVVDGEVIDVDLLFTHADGDLELRLYDEAGSLVASRISSSDNETITAFSAGSTGTWAVRIDPSGTVENTYDLTVTVSASQCVDDGFEPNNDQASAEGITSGVQVAGQTCGGSAQDDWFSFPVVDGELIDVDLLFTHADGDLELLLLDEAGVEKSSQTSITDNETIDGFVADSTGTWAVHVDPIASAENSYDLTVTVSCSDDAFESNDDQASAAPITSGVEVSGQVCAGAGEDDWFSFPVKAGDTIDVDLLFTHADGDLELLLSDEAGNVKVQQVSSSDNETIDAFVADSTGTWAVRIDPSGTAENSYDLTVTVTSLECPGDDDFESNDDQASAEPITSGTLVAGVSCGGDPTGNDWYSFPVEAGETIDASLLFTHGDGNLELRLYDEAGNIEISSTSITDDEAISGFVADTSGTWAVWVQPDGAAENSYLLGVDVTMGPCVDDAFEDNDSTPTAAPLTSGVTISAVHCDIDIYSYPVNAGDTIQVDLTFVHANGDLTADIFDEANSVVAVAASSTDNESITYVALTSGTFTTAVTPLFATNNTYDLTVTVTPSVPVRLCQGLVVTIDMNVNGGNGMGTAGDDVILGTPGNDTINGLAGNDTICGGNGSDTINGGPDNDLINGQGGPDFLFGDGGEDRINGGNGDDEIHGGDDDDDLRGQGNNDTMYGDGGVDQFFGGSGNDIIETGTGGNFGTSKVVRGGGNNDTITGSPDADQLEGGAGLDVINGEGGDDFIKGGLGFDRLNGGDGNDTINGEGSRDIIHGDADDDILNGGTGNDDLFGDGGADTMSGQGDTDKCDGGPDVGDTATASCETILGVP